MGVRKAREQAKVAAETPEKAQPKQSSTFFANTDDPTPQEFLTADDRIVHDQGENNQPTDRPPITPKRSRTFLDGASRLGPVSPLSTHRAQYEATPQAQARRAQEVAAKRDEQEARSRRGLEWLMSKLTGSK